MRNKSYFFPQNCLNEKIPNALLKVANRIQALPNNEYIESVLCTPAKEKGSFLICMSNSLIYVKKKGVLNTFDLYPLSAVASISFQSKRALSYIVIMLVGGEQVFTDIYGNIDDVCSFVNLVLSKKSNSAADSGIYSFRSVSGPNIQPIYEQPTNVGLFGTKKKQRAKGKTNPVVLAIAVLVAILIVFPGKGSKKSESKNSNSSSTVSKEAAKPDIELSTEFEKAAWKIVNENSGKLYSISDESDALYLSITCKNKEDVVNSILDGIAKAAQQNGVEKTVSCIFKKNESDSSNLILADVSSDGTYTIVFTHPDFKSKRNEWLNDNFSSTGECYMFSVIIAENINDEKSYEHIRTTQRHITDAATADEVNAIIAESGSSERVEIGDVFLATEFSAKNAFNATVKAVAYGFAGYNSNRVVLLYIDG